MSIGYNLLRVRIDLAALRHNYRLLNRYGSRLMPVVKADAYGHGLQRVFPVLAAEGADILAVGSVAEGAQLRQWGFGGGIVSLLGAVAPGDEELVASQGVIPFVGRGEQLASLGALARRMGRQVPVALKFDTGMSRLGFAPADLPEVLELLAANPGVKVALVASHLAAADEPDMPDKVATVLAQADRFDHVCTVLRAAGHEFDATLANSAAILLRPEMHHELQRPGIALYGANPLHGTSRAALGGELRPVMSVGAPVLEVRELEPGQGVSYGGTFVAERPMSAAVVAVGYADGYSRGLSGRGQMCLHGRRAAILGRVCMQMTVVDISDIPDARPGDDAWLLGGEGAGRVSPEELALWWGSIPYEPFCLLGLSPRSYEG